MAGPRKRPRATEEDGEGEGEGDISSRYEQSREQRIKENKEKMEKLGLFDLAHKLKPDAVAPRRRGSADASNKQKPPIQAPSRRSSRLTLMDPVSYAELPPKKKRESREDLEIRIMEGEKPEVYSEEQERALGDSVVAWTPQVDGYGEDGKRIYDNVNGETCHQCRQKTLGTHTHCCKCKLVTGQFCGDCLYARYGENVIEASQNRKWICPVCRDICNCSLCRKAKGWMPTGLIYKKVLKLGYKSVAHYLIQTRRAQESTDNSNDKLDGSNKNSLEDDGGKVKLLENDPVDLTAKVKKATTPRLNCRKEKN